MGTRSTYRFIEETKNPKTGKVKQNKLVLVYFQYDGYPDGHPLETCEWLSTGKVVNGYSNDGSLQFNGLGCLTAQFISKFKEGVGNVYIFDMKSRGHNWEDYTYDVILKLDGTIEFVGYEVSGSIRFTEFFRGTPSEFVNTFSTVENK